MTRSCNQHNCAIDCVVAVGPLGLSAHRLALLLSLWAAKLVLVRTLLLSTVVLLAPSPQRPLLATTSTALLIARLVIGIPGTSVPRRVAKILRTVAAPLFTRPTVVLSALLLRTVFALKLGRKITSRLPNAVAMSMSAPSTVRSAPGLTTLNARTLVPTRS